MPSWLTDVLKVVGLTTPFVYGYAVYMICLHFDKRGISAKAKAALANWLQPKEQDPGVVGDAVLEIFDRVYSKPLLSFRAFGRSSIITIVVTAICLYETWPTDVPFFRADYPASKIAFFFILSFLINIFLDYVSLFLVRHFLIIGRSKPITSALLAPVAGALFVFLIFTSRGVLVLLSVEYLSYGDRLFLALRRTLFTLSTDGLFVGALVVHLWLPLLAFSVGLVKLLNYFRAAVGMTQIILSRGGAHPLEAIGYVAGTIVFAVTAIGRLLLW